MDEGVITEVIMIMVVLVIGFTLIATMTPFLRSFSAPQAAPLAEVVYTYAEYNTTAGEGLWELYLYIYDNNPVDLYNVVLFSSQDITVNQVKILGPNGYQKIFTSGDNLDLTLSRGLYIIKFKYVVGDPANLNEVSYVVTLTAGHTLSGDTAVRKVT